MKKHGIILLLLCLLLATLASCSQDVCQVNFYVEGALYRSYKVEKGGFLEDEPDVPAKDGYKGVWSVTEFDEIKSDLRVDAIYTKYSYSVSFIADGETVYTESVGYGKTLSFIPDVPPKDGYSAAWKITDYRNITTDTVIEAVYTALPIYVTFYKNTFVYSVASVKVGDAVDGEYYELTSDYVRTKDSVFADGKIYYTRARERYMTVSVGDGRLVRYDDDKELVYADVPEAPAEDGLSAKWMKIISTPTGDVYEEAVFTNITASFDVVAEPYVAVTLVGGEETQTVGYEIGENIGSIRAPEAVSEDYSFYAWFYDESCYLPVEFPLVASKNVTLYAKWIYTKQTDGLLIEDGTVIGYTGTERDVYISSRYLTDEGYGTVTAIADGVFRNKNIQSIVLPASLTKLGSGVFDGCKYLYTASFPDGNYIEEYGESCFKGCTGLTLFTFSRAVRKIGSYAFYGCTALERADGLGEGTLKTVSSFSFAECPALHNLFLPSTVTTIETYAFSGDTELDITFNDENNIQVLGTGAFKNCKKFSGVQTEGLRTVGEKVFEGCMSLSRVCVGGASTVAALFGTETPALADIVNYYTVTVDARTYYVPRSLYSVLILAPSDGSIKSDVLYDCVSVKNVSFFGTVTKLSSYIFRVVNNEISSDEPMAVTLPSGLETVDDHAFATRKDIASIVLPKTVQSIGEYAFEGDVNLTSFTVEKGSVLTSVGKYALTDTAWYKSYSGLIGVGKVVIGISQTYCIRAGYYEITADKFSGYNTIAPYAFENNTVLRKIALGDAVRTIGDYAFKGCTALETFAFNGFSSAAERSLGTTVLSGCTSLRDLRVCEDFDMYKLFDGEELPASVAILRIGFSHKDSVIRAEIYNKDFITAKSNPAHPTPSVGYVYIEEGFTEIEEGAFSEYGTLHTLSLPKSMERIGKGAFAECALLEQVTFADGSVLEEVGEKAFYHCVALEKAALPDGVTVIGDEAFAKTVLTVFDAPESLERIGKQAFEGARLVDVTLPEGLLTIGNRAFADCDIKKIEIPSTVQFRRAEGGTVVFDGEEMLKGNNNFSELILSVGVEIKLLFGEAIPVNFIQATVKRGMVAEKEFFGITSLQTASLQSGVTAIGKSAFAGCTSLQKAVLPSSVVTVGESAFEGCVTLATVQIDTVDSRLKTIGNAAFKNCTKLSYIVLPATLEKSAWEEVFYGCSSLLSANLPEAVTTVGDRAYYGCSALRSFKMHDKIESVGEQAFYNCALIEFDDIDFSLLTEIGEGAFENCKKITNIRAENVSTVGQDAYKGCSSVTEITVLDEAISYYTDAFDTLNVINIAKNAAAVADGAFDGCTALQSVIVYSTDSEYPVKKVADGVASSVYVFVNAELYGKLSDEDKAAVSPKPAQLKFTYEYDEATARATVTGVDGGLPSGTKVLYLPEEVTYAEKTYTVTAIGTNAFLGADVEYIVIPVSVEFIDNAAFSRCSAKSVVFESGSRLAEIGNNAFNDCALIEKIALPSSLTVIGEAAFSGCASLSSVSFYANSKLVSIGINAFNGTTSLRSLRLTGPVASVGYAAFANSGLTEIDFGSKACFTEVSNSLFHSTYLTSLTLPSTVRVIGDNAFVRYAGTELTLPSGVEHIGKRAFYNATLLKTVTFGENLLTIGEEAFAGDIAVTSVRLPDSVTSVGANAFADCTSVVSLTLGKNLVTVGNGAFSGMIGLSELVFRAESIDDWTANNGIFTKDGMDGEGFTFTVADTVRSLPAHLFDSTETDSYAPNVANVIFDGVPNVESVGGYAFKNCYRLEEMTLPATVLSVGTGAFTKCDRLVLSCESIRAGVRWESGWEDLSYAVVYGADNYTDGVFSYAVHGEYAFLTDYSGANAVVLPDRFGDKTVYATGITFENSSITDIDFGDGVRLLGSFYGCSSLRGVALGAGMREVGEYAFAYCSSLLYVDLPSSVRSVRNNAFLSCDRLSSVYVSGTEICEELRLCTDTEEEKGLADICGGLFSSARFIYTDKDADVPFMTKKMRITGTESRIYSELTVLKKDYRIFTTFYWDTAAGADDSVYVFLTSTWDIKESRSDAEDTYILYVRGKGQMYDFSEKYPASWKGYGANILTVDIGNEVTALGRYAFSGLSGIEEVILRSDFGTDAVKNKFYFTDSGTDITLRVTDYAANVPAYLFYGSTALKQIVWESKKTVSVGAYAFYGCTGLTEITVPDSAVTLRDYAFYGCTKITSLTVGAAVKNLGTAVFGASGSDNHGFYLKTIYYNAVSAADMPDNQGIFQGNYKLGMGDEGVALNIARTVVSVPDYMFYGCNNIVSVSFGKDSALTTIGKSAFAFCDNITQMTLPLRLQSVGETAFSGCESLTDVSFAGTAMKEIGTDAFLSTGYYADSKNWTDGVLYLKNYLLTAKKNIASDYTVLNGTDIIAAGAFAASIDLSVIHIPSSVDGIGDEAFATCEQLKTVYISSASVFIGTDKQTAQGGLCANATVVYCLASIAKDNANNAGAYIKDGYRLVEKSTFIGDYTYYSYTQLYWQSKNTDVYMLNDQSRAGAYRMEIGGTGAMDDYGDANGLAPWYRAAVEEGAGVTVLNISKYITALGGYAFYGMTALTEINYADAYSVKSIGEAAFKNCTSLTKITVQKGTETIGKEAFSGCTAVTELNLNAVACKDFSDTYNGVFAKLGQLTENGAVVNIAYDVNAVPAYFLSPSGTVVGLEKNTDVTATSVPYIRETVFLGGANNRCVSVGRQAFANCYTMLSLTMQGQYLQVIATEAFYGCMNLEAVTVPSGVKEIGDRAFYRCVSMTVLSYAAAECVTDENGAVFGQAGEKGSGLTVAIAPTVVNVPDCLFAELTALKEVNFSGEDGNCVSVGRKAFYGCTSLAKIDLPSTLQSVGEGAFGKCIGLTKAVLPFVGGRSTRFSSSYETLFGYIFGVTSGEAPEGTTRIVQTYNGINEYSFDIPNSLIDVTINYETNVWYGAFMNCGNIEKITFTVSSLAKVVTEDKSYDPITNGYLIGSHAFEGCAKLSSLNLTEIVTDIGESAFEGCAKLTSVTIPVNVKTIGKRAFADCSMLTRIYYNASSCEDFKQNYSVFERVGSMQSGVVLEIGSSVTSIPDYFMYTQSSDKEDSESSDSINLVTINTVARLNNNNPFYRIGKWAFYGCTHLSEVTLPSTLTDIGGDILTGTEYADGKTHWSDNVLYYSANDNSYSYLLKYDESKAGAKSICNVKSGTAVIADEAFINSVYLEKIVFPNSLLRIGKSAFAYGNRLSTVTFAESSSLSLTIGEEAFFNCQAITTFQIMEYVTEIGNYAFYKCTEMQSVTIDSEKIAASLTQESSSGYLCYIADVVSVNNSVSYDKTGSYLKLKFSRKEGTEYTEYTRK